MPAKHAKLPLVASVHVWRPVLLHAPLRAVYAFGHASAAHRAVVRRSGVLRTFPALHVEHGYRVVCVHDFEGGPCAHCTGVGHATMGVREAMRVFALGLKMLQDVPRFHQLHPGGRQCIALCVADASALAAQLGTVAKRDARVQRRRHRARKILRDVDASVVEPLLEDYAAGRLTDAQLRARADADARRARDRKWLAAQLTHTPLLAHQTARFSEELDLGQPRDVVLAQMRACHQRNTRRDEFTAILREHPELVEGWELTASAQRLYLRGELDEHTVRAAVHEALAPVRTAAAAFDALATQHTVPGERTRRVLVEVRDSMLRLDLTAASAAQFLDEERRLYTLPHAASRGSVVSAVRVGRRRRAETMRRLIALPDTFTAADVAVEAVWCERVQHPHLSACVDWLSYPY